MPDRDAEAGARRGFQTDAITRRVEARLRDERAVVRISGARLQATLPYRPRVGTRSHGLSTRSLMPPDDGRRATARQRAPASADDIHRVGGGRRTMVAVADLRRVREDLRDGEIAVTTRRIEEVESAFEAWLVNVEDGVL